MKNQIEQLKHAKNAVILAHYYAPAEVQELADYVGDSFYLAKIAKQSEADIIVFCGVRFMGESAKILNPDKKVLMPDLTADCPLAHKVADGVIEEMKAKYRAGGYGYGHAKQALFEKMWSYFEPMRQKRAELENNLDFVWEVLRKGGEKAREEAQMTMDKVRKAVGLR